MPFDVYTAMGALVRAEASRSAAPPAGRSAGPSVGASADPPAGQAGFEGPPAGRVDAREGRRPGALPAALRRLTARLG
ncbi:hypothetical protein ACGFZP_16300 [Kitasatospora sp. NPDC048239]|uniref:hypothetical protein n=1 Tax=Kitasatospora sp. NPDC048239 TaxID=3364046 RepID=UPI00372109D3